MSDGSIVTSCWYEHKSDKQTTSDEWGSPALKTNSACMGSATAAQVWFFFRRLLSCLWHWDSHRQHFALGYTAITTVIMRYMVDHRYVCCHKSSLSSANVFETFHVMLSFPQTWAPSSAAPPTHPIMHASASTLYLLWLTSERNTNLVRGHNTH